MCLRVLEEDSKMIEFVPSKYITEQMSRYAVQQDYHNLLHIPPQFITLDLYQIVLKNTKDSTLWMIPKEHRTKEFCELAVYYWAGNLCFVPEHFKTRELCLLAIKKYIHHFDYVPDYFKDRAMLTLHFLLNLQLN